MSRVLEGVKVVDLTTYAAAPMAGRMLADFGAEVIKIEPLSGDPFRNFGLSCGAPVDELENPCYQLENANKRGITLNLKSEEGKEILFKLLKDANIFLTNTRMEALKKMQLSYEDLQPMFPHLIYGHISGFGLEGEEASLPGYDITAFWARRGRSKLAWLRSYCFLGERRSAAGLGAQRNRTHYDSLCGRGSFFYFGAGIRTLGSSSQADKNRERGEGSRLPVWNSDLFEFTYVGALSIWRQLS